MKKIWILSIILLGGCSMPMKCYLKSGAGQSKCVAEERCKDFDGVEHFDEKSFTCKAGLSYEKVDGVWK